MEYTILDHRLITAFENYLKEHKIKFRIEWKPCCVAKFLIEPEPEQRWWVQWGYYEIQWNLFYKKAN